jgi:hypothetical protein
MIILISFNPKAGLTLRLTIRISCMLRMQERTVSLPEPIMKMEVQDPEKLNDFEFGLRHNTAKRS